MNLGLANDLSKNFSGCHGTRDPVKEHALFAEGMGMGELQWHL